MSRIKQWLLEQIEQGDHDLDLLELDYDYNSQKKYNYQNHKQLISNADSQNNSQLDYNKQIINQV